MANFAKQLAKREKLVPHFNAYFNAGEFPDEVRLAIHPNKEKDDAFHPSSHSGACLRAMFAAAHGDLEAEKFDGTTQRIFQVGHMYHSWIQYLLVDELGFSTEADIELEYRVGPQGQHFDNALDWRTDPLIQAQRESGWWARGYTDVAHCNIPGHGDYLVDIKTVNSRYFAMERLPEAVEAKYELQLQMYMEWADQDQAILFCIQKDTPHAMKEFVFERDSSIAEAVYERWEVLADALRAGSPPPCDCADVNTCPTKGLYVASPRNRSGGRPARVRPSRT